MEQERMEVFLEKYRRQSAPYIADLERQALAADVICCAICFARENRPVCWKLERQSDTRRFL